MKTTRKLMLGLGALGALVFASKKDESEMEENSQPKTFYFSKAGYRRALQHEVTPEMTMSAVRSLSLPLGSEVDQGSYLVAVETHYNSQKGYHKGASIFLPT